MFFTLHLRLSAAVILYRLCAVGCVGGPGREHGVQREPRAMSGVSEGRISAQESPCCPTMPGGDAPSALSGRTQQGHRGGAV